MNPIFDEVSGLYPDLVWVDEFDTTDIEFMQSSEVLVVESNRRLTTVEA